MILYEKKISSKGKVTYIEHGKPRQTTFEINDTQMLTLATTVAICCLEGLRRHLPDSDIKHRKIRNVETEIGALARLSYEKLAPEMVDAGVMAWGAAMERVQFELSKCEAL